MEAKIYVEGGKYILDVDGITRECTVKTPSGWKETVFLPENETGRKLVNKAKLDAYLADHDEYPVSVIDRMPAVHTEREPQKPLEDYLEDDDRELFIELKKKAMIARSEARKPKTLTPLEKARRAVERAMAKVAALEEQNN